MNRDVLFLTLRELRQGDEIICTHRTYKAIRKRIDLFAKQYDERKIVARDMGWIKRIRRVV